MVAMINTLENRYDKCIFNST